MSTTLRRVRTVAVGIAAGVIGATAFATAAQACHVEIAAETACAEDGGWTVTWHTTNWNNSDDGTIDSVTFEGGELSGDIVADAPLPDRDSGATLDGVQTLSADEEEATISITATWPNFGPNGDTQTSTKTVQRPDEVCEPTTPPTDEPSESPSPATPEPSVAVGTWSDCAGMAVTAANQSETLAEFTFVPSAGDQVSGSPAVGEEFTQYFSVENPDEGLSVTVLVNGEEYETYQWDGGTNCQWGVVYDTCEGLEFELSVPAEASETTVKLTPSEGDVVEAVLTPGAEPQVFTFAASGDTLNVAWEVSDGKNVYSGEVPWTKPGDCEEAPPASETPSAAPQLPTTGSSLTIMIGSAAALILAAAVIFLIVRRRRVQQDW